jgi:molybdenum cofactor biosynthesis protein MoaC
MESQGVYAFEGIDDALAYIPLAARRALDVLGRKLSLEGWLSLAVDDRRRLVEAGAREYVDPEAVALVDAAVPTPSKTHPGAEADPTSIPPELAAALGPSRPLTDARWAALSGLGRYALLKYMANAEKLVSAYDEIVGVSLPHLTTTGAAHIIDIGNKPETSRRGVASACVRTTREVVEAIGSGAVPKGDVLAAARIAGILAAKRTPELLPLCHAVRTTRAAIDFESDAARGEVRVRATVEAIDRTGVEMEAMVAASIAALTVYDMIKSVDRWASIDAVRLEAKEGGKSGRVERPLERSGG